MRNGLLGQADSTYMETSRGLVKITLAELSRGLDAVGK